jgi:Holliday junction resolvase-like predicted endonuclease
MGFPLTELEREILIALLKQTRLGPADHGKLQKAVRVTDEALSLLLAKLGKEGLIEDSRSRLEASPGQRLGIAVRAIRSGADLERVSRALGWLEFEEMVAYALEQNGYEARSRFRFQAEGRRWEIDVLAAKKPLIICAECKHWSRGLGNMTARKIVEAHMKKVRVLSQYPLKAMKKLGLRSWERAVFVPVAMSLTPARERIYRRIPVVTIFELPSFLSEFEGQMDWLASFPVDLPPEKPRFTQTVFKRQVKGTRK